MTEIAIALEIGTALWRASEDLKLSEKFQDIFKKKQLVVVLGATGSGKTNLLVSLNAAAGLVEAVPRQNRTESSVTQRVRIKQTPFRIVDTPGQELHQSLRLRTVREAASQPPVRVINVVSYGYHEYGTNPSNAVGPDNQPRMNFLDEHRNEEHLALSEWLPVLGDRDTTKWVITAVTKADLWWHNQEEVLNHYRTGPYGTAINNSDAKLVHAVLPYCSVAHRFYDRGPIDGSFDDAERIRTNLHFLQQLVALG